MPYYTAGKTGIAYTWLSGLRPETDDPNRGLFDHEVRLDRTTSTTRAAGIQLEQEKSPLTRLAAIPSGQVLRRGWQGAIRPIGRRRLISPARLQIR